MRVIVRDFLFDVEDDRHFWSNVHLWERHSFEILNRFLNKDNILIDVGAWNGVLSLYGSKIAKYVYSFEPDRSAFDKLLKNVLSNKIENITIIDKGCGLKNGKQTLYIRREGDSTSSLIDRVMSGYESKSRAEIETIKLSEYIQHIDNIGLIKVDIEGGEIYLLEEMADYIREHGPTMYVSFHPNWFPDKDKNISDAMRVLSGYKHIYNKSLKEIDMDEAIKNLYGKEHCLIFSNEIC